METLRGRVQVRWDEQVAMTPSGQMAFFIEFLTVSGLFERWVELPAELHQPERTEQTSGVEHVVAINSGGTLAVSACLHIPVDGERGFRGDVNADSSET